MSWAHAFPTMLAAFLASLVEFVEALTVVLAVGVVRGWRPALIGTGLGLGLLTALVLTLGPALAAIPLGEIQLVVGTLLLLFGMRWLRKAILRAAGAIAHHDEAATFADESALLAAGRPLRDQGWDGVAIGAALKIVMLEGIEVVFIVIALGAGGGMLVPASLGAVMALAVVALLGVVVHRPLARVPENQLKFAVGVLLSAFGTFWVGEGMGVAWPGEDWSVVALIAAYLAVALVAVWLCRGRQSARAGE